MRQTKVQRQVKGDKETERPGEERMFTKLLQLSLVCVCVRARLAHFSPKIYEIKI